MQRGEGGRRGGEMRVGGGCGDILSGLLALGGFQKIRRRGEGGLGDDLASQMTQWRLKYHQGESRRALLLLLPLSSLFARGHAFLTAANTHQTTSRLRRLSERAASTAKTSPLPHDSDSVFFLCVPPSGPRHLHDSAAPRRIPSQNSH